MQTLPLGDFTFISLPFLLPPSSLTLGAGLQKIGQIGQIGQIVQITITCLLLTYSPHVTVSKYNLPNPEKMQPVLSVNRVFSFTRLNFSARFCGHFRNSAKTDWGKTTKSMSTRKYSWRASEGKSKQKDITNKQKRKKTKQTNNMGYICMDSPNWQGFGHTQLLSQIINRVGTSQRRLVINRVRVLGNGPHTRTK